MRGGLDDALDKLARRDELRRRAAGEATGTPPAVTDLVEAIAAVVGRHPELAVTVGVEGAGDPTLLRFFVDAGVVQVEADSTVAARAESTRHVDFDLAPDETAPDDEATEDHTAKAARVANQTAVADPGQRTQRITFEAAPPDETPLRTETPVAFFGPEEQSASLHPLAPAPLPQVPPQTTRRIYAEQHRAPEEPAPRADQDQTQTPRADHDRSPEPRPEQSSAPRFGLDPDPQADHGSAPRFGLDEGQAPQVGHDQDRAPRAGRDQGPAPRPRSGREPAPAQRLGSDDQQTDRLWPDGVRWPGDQPGEHPNGRRWHDEQHPDRADDHLVAGHRRGDLPGAGSAHDDQESAARRGGEDDTDRHDDQAAGAWRREPVGQPWHAGPADDRPWRRETVDGRPWRDEEQRGRRAQEQPAPRSDEQDDRRGDPQQAGAQWGGAAPDEWARPFDPRSHQPRPPSPRSESARLTGPQGEPARLAGGDSAQPVGPPSQRGEPARPNTRAGQAPRRRIPPPLAEPIPLRVDSDETEQAAKRLSALLRDNPSLLNQAPPD